MPYKNIFFTAVTLLAFGYGAHAQSEQNWTREQLISPAELATKIGMKKEIPVLFSVGPAGAIPNSISIGSVNQEANLGKFKAKLSSLKKNEPIVVYCGCCPYEHCPNVRPAMALLKDMKFTNYRLLDLPKNIKADWIDKGYPVTKVN